MLIIFIILLKPNILNYLNLIILNTILKYKLKEILEAILFFIKISSSWKNFIYKNINYNTIYKKYIKLNKYKIFELSYAYNLKKYLKKSKNQKL